MEEKINHLKEIQENFDNLQKEKADFDAKYRKLKQSYYETRCNIVNGVKLKLSLKVVTRNRHVTNLLFQFFLFSNFLVTYAEYEVPYFWFNAMKNHKDLAEKIMECDKDALKYLKDIECTTIGDPKGFELKFSFKSNPYFHNSCLTKTFHMGRYTPSPIKANGTNISWLEEKCLTEDEEKSFFNFFKDIPNDDYDYEEESYYKEEAKEYKNDEDAAQGKKIEFVHSSDEIDYSADENVEEEETETETETEEEEEIGLVDSSDENDKVKKIIKESISYHLRSVEEDFPSTCNQQ